MSDVNEFTSSLSYLHQTDAVKDRFARLKNVQLRLK